MRLLFDQNLSFRLCLLLADIFPESAHIRQFSLEQVSDHEVWEFAKHNDYILVSKDDDFHHLSFLYGAPPQVIGLGLGNCQTSEVETVLRRNFDMIQDFALHPEIAFLKLP